MKTRSLQEGDTEVNGQGGYVLCGDLSVMRFKDLIRNFYFYENKIF